MTGEAFFELLRTGSLNDIQLAVENNQSLVQEEVFGLSCVVYSAYHGKMEIAQWLSGQKETISFSEHIILGNVAQVQRHLQRSPSERNSFLKDGFTPLGLACFFEQLDVVKLLLSAKVDVNTPSNNDFRVTPLHSSVAKGNLAITRLLLNEGAQVNAEQRGGVTPLHSAVHNNQLELVQLLLEFGANPRAPMSDGTTPRDMAADHSNLLNLLDRY